MPENMSYENFISTELLAQLNALSRSVEGVPELREVGKGGGLESAGSLRFLCELYELIAPELHRTLALREKVRHFTDERTKACYALNQSLRVDYQDPRYETVIGHEDAEGKIPVGPLNSFYCKSGGGKTVAEIPSHLKGPHVTLFGPPDSAKLSINAMNAYHRKIPGEPAIVGELLFSSAASAMWGADDEDSKTPLRADLVEAGINLAGCFNATLSFVDPNNKKTYALAEDHLSLPIKRFPGLALPSLFFFLRGKPLPLHLYDFALHFYEHWKNPKALAFYVPKLESESEAQYIHLMVETAERMIQKLHPEYSLGSVRILVVLENPRAIFRANEIMDALHPYFAGASLGWHDFLASTARLFKDDANYRIPVKADPDIVIKYIKASHELLANVVGSRGGIKIGGMYGILPMGPDLKSPSFQLALKGFFKDVLTQMKRNLSGFWVAHPDFVRLGLAMVEGWKLYQSGDKTKLRTLIVSLLEPKYQQDVLDYVESNDVAGLDTSSPLYPRSLIVADLKESGTIANNHPDEVRYNIFQSLQYLTDWLSGNGCVALPAVIEGVPVRVMDDLATAERSRWEVWHEIHHGRFSVEEFIRISHEELLFIRKDLSDSQKIVQVKWDQRTEKWYPIAMRLMLQLMTCSRTFEFASELLLPFTIESVRNHSDPWFALTQIAPQKYELEPYVDRLHEYFSLCGSLKFAKTMAQGLTADLAVAEKCIMSFSQSEIIEAAYFHGDIGESVSALDATAAGEQALVQVESEKVRQELRTLGESYRKKFGFKFLISAKGKPATEIRGALNERMNGSAASELENARRSLWEITQKRLSVHRFSKVRNELVALLKKHGVNSAQIAIAMPGAHYQTLNLGTNVGTYFELASLSKPIASCFALEYFSKKQISLDTSVNTLLKQSRSAFRIESSDPKHPEWADLVTLRHLLEHTALNLHYVPGVSASGRMPPLQTWLGGSPELGVERIRVTREPGKTFMYSGGGFLVVEHLIEVLEGKSVQELTELYFAQLGIVDLTFQQETQPGIEYATGYLSDGSEVPGKRKMFPAFAAGGMGTSTGMLSFLSKLEIAYSHPKGSPGISHDTAVQMLHGSDRGSRAFMGAAMGLGIFILEAGSNRFMAHQGANDGFRCLFLHCYQGPDRGKGFVILVNADTGGVNAIAEMAQLLLSSLEVSGIDETKFMSVFDSKAIRTEERVNRGYKELIFDAFRPDLPEMILRPGPEGMDPLSQYNLAVGGKITEVSNQRFARAENLLSPFSPQWDPEAYGRQGKIMDSWESVRHNPNGFDFLVFRMLRAESIHFVEFSTAYHLGNQPSFVRLLGRHLESEAWIEMVPKTALEGHSLKQVQSLDTQTHFQWIRVEMFPDGGLTRLGLFGENLPVKEKRKYEAVARAKSIPIAEKILQVKKPLVPKYETTSEIIRANWSRLPEGAEVDVASSAFGGKILSASNEHYGPATQLISPYPPLHMFDGFESSRSRVPGHFEEVVVELGRKSVVHRIEIDFTYFVNNNPVAVLLEGLTENGWLEIVEKTAVKAYAGNTISFVLHGREALKQLKVRVYPDGGMNRLRALATNIV